MVSNHGELFCFRVVMLALHRYFLIYFWLIAIKISFVLPIFDINYLNNIVKVEDNNSLCHRKQCIILQYLLDLRNIVFLFTL